MNSYGFDVLGLPFKLYWGAGSAAILTLSRTLTRTSPLCKRSYLMLGDLRLSNVVMLGGNHR